MSDEVLMPHELTRGSPPAEVDTRLSFMDSITELCLNCNLARLVNPDHWPLAANDDIAAANTLFSHLAEDLTAITGVKCHPYEYDGIFDVVAYHPYNSVEERVAALKAEFVKAVQDRVRFVLTMLRKNYIQDDQTRVLKKEWSGGREYNVYAKTIYPLTPVSFTKDIAGFKFPHGKGQNRKVYEFGLSTWALVDPGDHNMSIPIRTMQKLEVLKTTHFNYHPKILRGVLVRKAEVEMERREFVRVFNPDPALVVHLGWQMAFVCDYWEDPAAKEDMPPEPFVAQRPTVKEHVATTFFCLALILVGMGGIGAWYWSTAHWALVLLMSFIGLMFAGVGAGCSYAHWLDTFGTRVPPEDPVKYHEMKLG